LAGKIWETGRPIIVDDYHVWEGRASAYQVFPVAAVVGVPIQWGSEFLGVLDVWARAPQRFTQADAELLSMLAAQAAIAVQNARLYQAERAQYARLQESQTQLIQAEKMIAMSRLVTSVTHHIGNPLQAVEGCLGLIREELHNGARRDKLERYVGVAEKETERIAAIIHRIRGLSEPARQGMHVIQLPPVLLSALEALKEPLQHNNIRIEQDWPADLPPVQANPEYLRYAFVDLARYAIDAMEITGGTLRIRAALDALPDAPPVVRIEFSDTSAGIEPAALPHVFDPFMTARKDKTGLGLFISYGIIELHNGQLTVTSTVGQGTHFTVRLPAEPMNSEDQGRERPSEHFGDR
jgi:signal transduction histidine kinase